MIGGWAPGQGRRAATIGALLLGVPTKDGLGLIGNVGTGFTDAMLANLLDRLTTLAQPASPFTEPVPREFARHAYWAAPEIVGEVEYRTISRDGRLRHPSWRGLRRDKSPADVTDHARTTSRVTNGDHHARSGAGRSDRAGGLGTVGQAVVDGLGDLARCGAVHPDVCGGGTAAP
ncbi:MAG: bifunctional non-ous end joining protein LigD [Pseudonocardiales bacterium]|nr:bifunctional non-ous end joining protein LigD [Pseudonocardiales bacterium]